MISKMIFMDGNVVTNNVSKVLLSRLNFHERPCVVNLASDGPSFLQIVKMKKNKGTAEIKMINKVLKLEVKKFFDHHSPSFWVYFLWVIERAFTVLLHFNDTIKRNSKSWRSTIEAFTAVKLWGEDFGVSRISESFGTTSVQMWILVRLIFLFHCEKNRGKHESSKLITASFDHSW